MKNIKLHFELLTQSWLVLQTQFYPCSLLFKDHQDKTSPFFWLPAKSNYNLLVTINPGTQK